MDADDAAFMRAMPGDAIGPAEGTEPAPPLAPGGEGGAPRRPDSDDDGDDGDDVPLDEHVAQPPPRRGSALRRAPRRTPRRVSIDPRPRIVHQRAPPVGASLGYYEKSRILRELGMRATGEVDARFASLAKSSSVRRQIQQIIDRGGLGASGPRGGSAGLDATAFRDAVGRAPASTLRRMLRAAGYPSSQTSVSALRERARAAWKRSPSARARLLEAARQTGMGAPAHAQGSVDAVIHSARYTELQDLAKELGISAGGTTGHLRERLHRAVGESGTDKRRVAARARRTGLLAGARATRTTPTTRAAPTTAGRRCSAKKRRATCTRSDAAPWRRRSRATRACARARRTRRARGSAMGCP